jgi:hypothetical protein
MPKVQQSASPPAATTDHGNVNVINVVFDGESQQKMRELAFIESKNRAEFGVNMLQIESNAKEAGFMTNTDSPEDIEAEFYTEAEPEKPPVNITDRAELVLDGVQDESFVEPVEPESVEPEETELDPTIEEEEPEKTDAKAAQNK